MRDDDTRVTAIDDAFDVNKSQVFGWDANTRLTSTDIGAWPSPMGYAWSDNANLTGKVDVP